MPSILEKTMKKHMGGIKNPPMKLSRKDKVKEIIKKRKPGNGY